ncbi:WD40-repeat-containing domain protein [Rhodocollybia butyracea]|uniref:WD40-repeat-containing domain protein n=1 Tax=Rhodocollybia butyracea TaxID=206335 RepID=A0A9P5PMG4_9AGAR|nr:WD40-repeat-containing domain protein [Rhodocollybia butyracea]
MTPSEGASRPDTEDSTKFAETRHVLFGHSDQVWNLEWSPGGSLLASGGKDNLAIIWCKKSDELNSNTTWEAIHVLLHEMPVSCLAWSSDESLLLTSAEYFIYLWDTKSGKCLRTLDDAHGDTVTSLLGLPDGLGYISGGIDRKIVHWNAQGELIHQWYPGNLRILSMDLIPNQLKLAIVGLQCGSNFVIQAESELKAKMKTPVYQLLVHSIVTRRTEKFIRIEEGSSCLCVSSDARHVLVNSRNEISLWDMRFDVKVGRYMGHKNRKDVLRSCFSGGGNDRFILSGSEDGRILVWNRLTGVLQSVLQHGGHNLKATISAVRWHPLDENVFASCSDDHTIRIWEMDTRIVKP